MNQYKIVGVYLAGGLSHRMGSDKLLLPFGGAQLGNKALYTGMQSQLSNIIIVTYSKRLQNWELPQGAGVSTVDCEASQFGLSESIKCGVLKSIEVGATHVVIMLADQPFISERLINNLIERATSCQYDFVFSCLNGIPRPPAIFHQTVFKDLLELKGDQGAQKLFYLPQYHGCCISYENMTYFIDVDTKEDYNTALRTSAQKK